MKISVKQIIQDNTDKHIANIYLLNREIGSSLFCEIFYYKSYNNFSIDEISFFKLLIFCFMDFNVVS